MSDEDPKKFERRYGPTALVIGGSHGIGLAFARALALRGLDLCLVALDDEALPRARAQVEAESGRRVRALPLDMAAPGCTETLIEACRDEQIGTLVCNAARVPVGPLLAQDPGVLSETVNINVAAPLLLVRHFAASMASRGRGGVVLMSSLAGLGGAPLVASYAASRAFTRVLAEGLWHELGAQGVHVVACMPGTVRTPTLEASGARLEGHPLLRPITAAQVARETLDALGAGPVVTPGLRDRITSWLLSRALPRRTAVRLVARNLERMYPKG